MVDLFKNIVIISTTNKLYNIHKVWPTIVCIDVQLIGCPYNTQLLDNSTNQFFSVIYFNTEMKQHQNSGKYYCRVKEIVVPVIKVLWISRFYHLSDQILTCHVTLHNYKNNWLSEQNLHVCQVSTSQCLLNGKKCIFLLITDLAFIASCQSKILYYVLQGSQTTQL